MIIGLLENGNRLLKFHSHSKKITEKEWKEMFIGEDARTCSLIKTDILTNKEFQELHENIEAKRNSIGYGLMKINKEMIK